MLKKFLNLINDKVKGGGAPEPNSKAQALIDHLTSVSTYSFKLKEDEIGREILRSDPTEQKEIVLGVLGWLTRKQIELQKKLKHQGSAPYEHSVHRVKSALEDLLRKKLPLSEEEVISLLTWSMVYEWNAWRAIPPVIKQVQDFQKREGRTTRLTKKLTEYVDRISQNQYDDAETRQQIRRLRELSGEAVRNPLVAGETWSDLALSQLATLNDTKRAAWIEFLNLCVASKGSTPTAKWQKASDTALKKIGWKNVKLALMNWFPLVDKPRTQRIERWPEWSADPNLLINNHNADILKGLVWATAKKTDPDVLRAIAALAISVYRKVPGIGPRCVRVGNACVWVLSQAKDGSGVSHLAVLKARVKTGSVQKVIDKALAEVAKRANLPKEEIEEMSVPTFGLSDVGSLTRTLGDHTAHLSILGTDDVQRHWSGPNEKIIKSTPASVKNGFVTELKALTQAKKDIGQMLAAQRDRIDSAYLGNRTWTFGVWSERYLNHPLVGTIARRLIWKFRNGTDAPTSGIWLDGQLVTADRQPVDRLGSDTTVVLWHPLDEKTEAVLEWRDFLEANGIRQPFKQAHREIYLLTDAERTTNVYSNRYAAHILKQHQFNALCSARRWKNKLRLMVDDEYPPATRLLPNWNLRAEFWIEGIGDNYGEDTNEAGTYFYLTTDQVRFYPIDARQNSAHAGGGGYGTYVRGAGEATEPLRLEEIPPLVFSEIMRDVDLFVGVASIGNDPNWLDTGTDGNHRNYWYDYSFGDLSVSAKTRKEILEGLVPKLKIASRCSFDDKFLIVKGDIRTYKIHLGSGNILMKPNDQYLCIVAKQSTASSERVFLPFEGDQRVAVILSKAFLLADDAKIDDPVIVRQIK